MSWASDQWGQLPGRYTARGYRTAHVIRTSGRGLPAEGSADQHLRADREVLGRESDRLDRDNAQFEMVLDRIRDITLGRSGFTLRMRTDDDDLNEVMEADFRGWGKAPETRALFSWEDCEDLSLRARLCRGDIGVAFTNQRKLMYIESARIAGGRRAARAAVKVEQGVELDELDRPLAYWVAPYDKWGSVRLTKAKRIKADDFLLSARRKKFSQTRGVPELTTILPLIHRINDILDSEAIGWQQLARLVMTVSLEGGAGEGYSLSDQDTDGRDAPPDLADRIVDIEQGTIFFGNPGEDIKAVQRDLPGANFVDSARMFLTLISAQSGIPLSVLLLDFSGTTYTSSRAEVESAWRVAIRRQKELKRQHHDPITERWIRWGIEDGRYPDREIGEGGFYQWEWIAPEFPWIDQLKEAQAWGQRLDRGLATQRQALQSVNMELEDYHSQRSEEVRRAMTVAKDIHEEFPDEEKPDWRMFCGYPAAKTTEGKVPEKKDPAPSTLPPAEIDDDQGDKKKGAGDGS